MCRLLLTLPPESESFIDGCNISISSERLDVVEQSESVLPGKTADARRRSGDHREHMLFYSLYFLTLVCCY